MRAVVTRSITGMNFAINLQCAEEIYAIYAINLQCAEESIHIPSLLSTEDSIYPYRACNIINSINLRCTEENIQPQLAIY